MVKIESHDQKGGITANKVNINSHKSSQEADQSPKRQRLWKNPWFKYFLIPLAVAIIAGLIIWGIGV